MSGALNTYDALARSFPLQVFVPLYLGNSFGTDQNRLLTSDRQMFLRPRMLPHRTQSLSAVTFRPSAASAAPTRASQRTHSESSKQTIPVNENGSSRKMSVTFSILPKVAMSQKNFMNIPKY